MNTIGVEDAIRELERMRDAADGALALRRMMLEMVERDGRAYPGRTAEETADSIRDEIAERERRVAALGLALRTMGEVHG